VVLVLVSLQVFEGKADIDSKGLPHNRQLYEVDAVIVGRSACRTVRTYSLAIPQVNWSTNDAAMCQAALVLKR
jgi:hypothetical protein